MDKSREGGGMDEKFIGKPQYLRLDAFADKMDVCTNTVRKWMDDGVLVKGEHYLKNEKTIRFPWSDELSASIMKAVSNTPRKKPKVTSKRGTRRKLKYRA